jgi:hypothetical protein
MSEDQQTDNQAAAQPNSIIGNLTNKIKYNLHKATYDPTANKFVEEQTKQEQAATTKETTTTTEEQSDPNKFSASRVAKKIGNQTWTAIQKGFIPFLSLMLGMIVANAMIVYPFPIRLIFFIFTVILCNLSSIIAVIIGIFFALKGLYSYYYNNMTDRPKREIMPTIFALLPITTYKPLSPLAAALLYPFTYPKTEQGAQKLPEIMKEYWEDLKNSFAGFDKVKNLPAISTGIEQIQKNMAKMHEVSEPQETNINETQEEAVENAD